MRLSPDRFAAFASLALQYPDLAVEQLEHAVKRQGPVLTLINETLSRTVAPVKQFLGLLV